MRLQGMTAADDFGPREFTCHSNRVIPGWCAPSCVTSRPAFRGSHARERLLGENRLQR
jgi:hypothetical protein